MACSDLPRKKLLIVAYSCDPESFMESRLGWHRSLEAAKHLDTWVICEGDASHQKSLNERVADIPGLSFHCVSRTKFEKRYWNTPGCLYHLYNRWHRRAFQLASALHSQVAFDLTHQVNFCGFREPGYLGSLNVPFIWGPVGGTQNFPLRFLGETSVVDGLYEFFRGIINTFDLRLSRRVRRAALEAVEVIAANTTVQRDFKSAFGRDTTVQLETGLREIEGRRPADRTSGAPLKILWAGRYKAWKGFPLLVKSLAMLPPDVKFRVRVMGYGVCEQRWKRLATKFGLADRIEWVGWPSYTNSFEHYRWADVFAFTSLRDTSGTGLLESLSCGVPIIGLNHQGAADIVTSESGILVDPKSKSTICNGFSAALETLYREPETLEQLKQGALKRASDFHWNALGESMARIYERVLQSIALKESKTSLASVPISAAPPDLFQNTPQPDLISTR